MLILRFFGENSPRIIAASGADPAVLKMGSQALVCQFLPNLYTNFTKEQGRVENSSCKPQKAK
jgi:hypothetical protein